MIRCLTLTCALVSLGISSCSNRKHTDNLKDTVSQGAIPERSAKPGQPSELNSPANNAVVEKPNTFSFDTTQFPVALADANIRDMVEAAKVFFDTLVEAFPTDSDAFDICARYYFLIGNHEVARSTWQQGLLRNPNDAFCYNGLGLISQAGNDFLSAEKHFRQASSLKPQDPTVEFLLAQTLVKLGRLEDAIVASQHCIELDAESIAVRELLGNTYLALQKYDLAKQVFEEALQLSPDSYVSQQGMATSLIRLGRRDEAKQWMTKQNSTRALTQTDPHNNEAKESRELSQHLGLAAKCYAKHGKTEAAVSTLKFAAACAPDETLPAQQLIDVYLGANLINEAISLAEMLIESYPHQAGFRIGLVEIYLKQQRWELADQTLSEAIKQDPSNPVFYAVLVKLLLNAKSDSSRMLEASQSLVSLRGNAADRALHAQVLYQLGNLAGAIESLELAIQQAPDNPAFRSILSQLQLQMSGSSSR